MLTVKDVCEKLNVSVRTIYRLIKSGQLPAKRIAGQWRFELPDLDRLTIYKSPTEYVIKPDLMSLNEACVYLDISRFTIYRLLKSQKLSAVKSGGQWRFAKDDVRKFLTHGREVPSHVLGMNFEGGVLGLSEVATILGVNRRTIYRLIKDGKLPATKVGNDWRIIKTELARYMLNRKFRYAPDGVRGLFFAEQVLDKYRKDKQTYYVSDSAYDGLVGSRQAFHDYKTLRSLKAIPKDDRFFAEVHYRKVPVKGGHLLTIGFEQYSALPPKEHAHWSEFRVSDKQLRTLEL